MERSNEVLLLRRARGAMALLQAGWAAASMLIAMMLWLLMSSFRSARLQMFVEAFAAQCLIWGFINVCFALVALRQAQVAQRTAISAQSIGKELADRDKLLRLLRFTIRLNLALISLGAVTLLIGLIMLNMRLLGHGAGMLIQGGFLLILDRYSHARLGALSRA